MQSERGYLLWPEVIKDCCGQMPVLYAVRERLFTVARGHQRLLWPDASTICSQREAIYCGQRSSKIVVARCQYYMQSERGYLLWPEVIKDCCGQMPVLYAVRERLF